LTVTPSSAVPGQLNRRASMDGMVLEVAQFDILAGRDDAFAATLAEGRMQIPDVPGQRSIRIARGVETSTRFDLIVEWDSIEAHQEFTTTKRFGEWLSLISPYFASAPVVEHFTDLTA
jgi:heme-degrading monooxygenase HmoA